MGPEWTGLGPRELWILFTKYVLMCRAVCIIQSSGENGWNGSSARLPRARVVGLKYVPCIGYEPRHLLDLVGPEM